MEYLCRKWQRIWSTFCKHFPVVSSFMTYHRVCNYINTTGVTSGAGIVYTSGAPEFTLGFSRVSVTRSLVLCACFVDHCLSFCTFSFGHYVVCSSLIYGFWLHLWPLCCLFFFDIRILITPLISFCHCVVCSSLIYGFWLHLWYLVVLVLSVLLWYTDSDYTFGILWPLCCLVLFNMRILIPPLVSCGHCFVSSSLIYGFWLHHWYLVTIVVSVLLWYTDSDYTFGILWPLRCLIFFDIRILITPLVSSNFS
jgi:hypothetical protein